LATIGRFEELEVWKISMELCVEVYKLTYSELFSKDFGLKDQVRRCSVSIPSNISEGFERESYKQFMYFLQVSKASCGELRTQLNIAFRLNYISDKEYNEISEKCVLVSKQIKGFSKYIKTFNEKEKTNR
jgi:four helix bundle protein